MLRIRREQMDVFASHATDLFVNEIWDHFQEFAPNVCETAKEENVKQVIRIGIDRAASYRFTNRGPVRFFIELMFSFGSDFDSDPQYHWATEVLSQGSEAGQTYRANCLFKRYEQFATASIGPNNDILVKALRRLETIDPKDFVTQNGDTRAELREAISQIYPERYSFVGRERVDAVVESAIAIANRHNAVKPASFAIATTLAILVGHRFDNDLLYPWIGKALNRKSRNRDPDVRFETLMLKSKIYLGEVVKYWEGS